LTLFDQVQETVSFIKKQTNFKASIGVVLGTGLGELSNHIEVVYEIQYKDIPHFPVSTVESHKSKLIFGTLNNCPIIAMAGRFHYYEGYSMKEVTFPIRVLKFLGIQTLIQSNVSGSVNPNYDPGDILVIRDHINLHPENPLRGENDERFGPRFPDMLKTYSKKLRSKMLSIGRKLNLNIKQAVYLSLQGPNLETPAEYNYFHQIGADLIGMSTVPEVIVARHMGMEVCVLSIVSNKCYPIDEITETTIEEVIAIAATAEPKLTALIKAFLNELT